MTALSFRAVSTVDYHTGGEPFRIVAAPSVDLPGATVAERRMRAIGDPHADGLRKLLCWEPRGHADMYGGFIGRLAPPAQCHHLRRRRGRPVTLRLRLGRPG